MRAAIMVGSVAVALGCRTSIERDHSDSAAAAAGTCSPLTITVDGEPVTGLGFGKAVTTRNGTAESLTVHLFGDDTVDCAALLDHGARQRGDGERTVRALLGVGPHGSGVGIDTHTQMDRRVALQGPAPRNASVGAPVTLCVDHAAVTPMAGRYRDRAVVINGAMVGAYCGVLQFGN